jgi:tetratricopeptide (TPR) repeat protein
LELRAGLWLVLGQVSNALYLTPQALDAAQRARDAFQALGDERHLPYALQSVGFALTRAGIHDDAELALRRAQELAEREGNRRLFMRALLRRAQNVYSGRSLEQSLPLYEQALQLARVLQDDLYEGYIVGHMADVYFALGDPARSISLADAARGIFERRRDASQESNALANLAAYHLVTGDLSASKELARCSVARAREAESPVNGVAAVQHLGAFAALQGQLQTGALLLGFADEAFTNLYFSRTQTECSTREKAMESLRGGLSGAELDALLKEGASLSNDEAFTLALSV